MLSRRKIEGLNTIIGDRKDQTLLNNVVKKDYDYIIDFIGYCLPDAKKLVKVLSLGSYKTKIIFISTTYVYNKEQRRDCFKEDTFNPYDYVGNLLEREQISYEEVLALSKITRNSKGLIIDPFHTTIPILSRYEFAKIIGIRTKQLNHGSTPFIDNLDPNIIDGYTIAMKEFKLKKIPFIIKRPLPNGVNEYWNVKDLEYVE